MEQLQSKIQVPPKTVKKVLRKAVNKPIITPLLTCFMLFIHMLLAFANFGLQTVVRGVQQQVDKIDELAVTLLLPVVMALLIAPLLAAGKHTKFSTEFNFMLFCFVCLNLVVDLFRMSRGLI